MTIIKKIPNPKKRKDVKDGLFNLLKVKTDIKVGNVCIEQCEARAPGPQYAENCTSACQATGLA